MHKLQSTVGKFLTVTLLSGSLTNSIAQQVKCISESSSGLFGSNSKSTCYVGNNHQKIKEGETLVIDGVTYTMLGGQVNSKIDYSKPRVDPKDCKVESYANENGAGSRVVCGGKIISDSQAK